MIRTRNTFMHENSWFLWPYLVIAIATLLVLLIFSKSEIHLFINQHHHPISDVFFKYITWLGDGNLVLLVGLFFLFFSFRKSLTILSLLIAIGLVVQPLKRFVFEDQLRPKKYFEGIYELHFIEGVKVHGFNSFPSGHATTAFGLLFLLAIYSKNKWIKVGLLALSLLAAFSRVYLSQHFLVDIFAGSLIGISLAIIANYYFSQKKAQLIYLCLISFLKK